MRRKVLCAIAGLMLVSAAALAQPSIRASNGVLNASSYTADVARGSWFVVFGSGLGPASLVVFSGSLPYPTELSGTKVNFTPAAGGTAVDARLWYTSAGQLAALLPSSTAAGDYDVRVTYNGTASAAYRVKVVERNFGFATQAQNGAGPAQATYGGADLNRFTTGQLGQYSTRPAKANDTMVLWGTGLGADTNSDLTGASSGDQTVAAQVRVIVGGIEVTPAYAGRSGGSPGLDQINFTVPGNVAQGCFVSLQVRAGGRLSNAGSIAVAEPGEDACKHPTLTSSQLKNLDQGKTMVVGGLGVLKLATKVTVPVLGTVTSSSESAFGSFSKYTIDTVATANFSLVQTGACYVFKRTGTTDQVIQGVAPAVLDAGPQLTLNGPNASNKAIPKQAGSQFYDVSLYTSSVGGFGGSGSPTISSGTYTIAGTGGADIGAFSAKVDVPGDFTWTNQDTIPDPIPRSTPLTVNWTGGGTGMVTIAGAAMRQSGGTTQSPVYDATVFDCIAPASAGTFTVPTSVLQQLPVVVSDILSGSLGTLSVFAFPDVTKGQGSFSAPLTAGGTIDQGFFTYSIGASKSAGWN